LTKKGEGEGRSLESMVWEEKRKEKEKKNLSVRPRQRK